MAMDNNDFTEFGWEDVIIDDGKEFVLLEEGDYSFTVLGFERARHPGSTNMPPCNMAKVKISIDTPDGGFVELTDRLYLCKKFEWKLSQFFACLGMKKKGEPLKMNWPAITGKTGRCHVYVDSYEKQDGTQGRSNKIKTYYPKDEGQTEAAVQTGGWTAGKF